MSKRRYDPKKDETLEMKMLRMRVEANQQERARYKAVEARLNERKNEIQAAPWRTRISFFCDQCDADWDGTGFKQIRWPKGTLWFAYYKGYCPQGHPCFRRITDRLGDMYFFKSYVIRKEQARHADEFLPHWHPRFKQVYPERYRELVLREKGIQT